VTIGSAGKRRTPLRSQRPGRAGRIGDGRTGCGDCLGSMDASHATFRMHDLITFFARAIIVRMGGLPRERGSSVASET